MEEKTEIKLTASILNGLLETFEGRAKYLGFKGKEKMSLQHEFITGAIACIDAINDNDTTCITPMIYFSVIRGEMIQPMKP